MKTTKTVRGTCYLICTDLKPCWDVCRLPKLDCLIHNGTPLLPGLGTRICRGCLFNRLEILPALHKEVESLLAARSINSLLFQLHRKSVYLSCPNVYYYSNRVIFCYYMINDIGCDDRYSCNSYGCNSCNGCNSLFCSSLFYLLNALLEAWGNYSTSTLSLPSSGIEYEYENLAFTGCKRSLLPCCVETLDISRSKFDCITSVSFKPSLFTFHDELLMEYNWFVYVAICLCLSSFNSRFGWTLDYLQRGIIIGGKSATSVMLVKPATSESAGLDTSGAGSCGIMICEVEYDVQDGNVSYSNFNYDDTLYLHIKPYTSDTAVAIDLHMIIGSNGAMLKNVIVSTDVCFVGDALMSINVANDFTSPPTESELSHVLVKNDLAIVVCASVTLHFDSYNSINSVKGLSIQNSSCRLKLAPETFRKDLFTIIDITHDITLQHSLYLLCLQSTLQYNNITHQSGINQMFVWSYMGSSNVLLDNGNDFYEKPYIDTKLCKVWTFKENRNVRSIARANARFSLFFMFGWSFRMMEPKLKDVFRQTSLLLGHRPGHGRLDVSTVDNAVFAVKIRRYTSLKFVFAVEDKKKKKKYNSAQNHHIYHVYHHFVLRCYKYNILLELDRIDDHKGVRPCATPDLPDEHFVFLLSQTCQGTANSRTRIIERSINYKIYKITTSYKCSFRPFGSLCAALRYVVIHTSHLLCRGLRQVTNYCKTKIIHDIETNPGPNKNVTLTVITLNCRGLGNIDKFRLLLNKIYNLALKGPVVALLQETMIVNDNYLALAWRGKYVLTPGTGNSKGCITLFSANVEIGGVHHYGHRGHRIIVTDEVGKQHLVCNIYAPLGFDENKSNFFDEVFNDILEWESEVILGGDLNITLQEQDRHCRGATSAELRLAEEFKNYIHAADLEDCFAGRTGYTWRKGHKMSKLDRVYTRLEGYEIRDTSTNWSYTQSDHACVLVKLEHRHQKYHRNEHVKLDDKVVTDKDTLLVLREYLITQLDSAGTMAPHMLLEFAKMTIRTKALEIMAKQRKKENEKLAELNTEINRCTQLLTRYLDADSQLILTRELEELTHAKNTILEEQGVRLAFRARTKWYNEGERSNKYFLNLLKNKYKQNEMLDLEVDGRRLTDSFDIRKEVTSFYNSLYNQEMSGLSMDANFLDEMFRVDDGMDEYLCAPLTLGELWNTLKSTRATTPGPDGMSNTYLKKLWDIIGPLILEAWNYSLVNGFLPPSHCTSLLRLIPKAGKDLKQIKNWRPITLSNCDHKLITRVYNSRLLRAIGGKLTTTQTAYVRGCNIADNLRLVNSVVKLADIDNELNATLLALDAQKAFDSINHNYLTKVLHKVGLCGFTSIFKLLYKDLKNDIIINGRIGKGYSIGNGVKQGDALSCSLFLLAIEPLILNITKNDSVTPVFNERINYTWPKVIAYADDITVITNNRRDSISAVFKEYDRLTRASGLKLNADKTERFDISGRGVDMQLAAAVHEIDYGGMTHYISPLQQVKINGIVFHRDRRRMAELNYRHMRDKMMAHFRNWSKRSLTLLGKIQIIKTFGMSQYLYSLAVIDIDADHWAEINKLINKFLWNKHFSALPAPHRIKKDIINQKVCNGGFGMIQLQSVASATRLKRCSRLLAERMHPVGMLQVALHMDCHLQEKAKVEIDDITSDVIRTLRKQHLQAYGKIPQDMAMVDLVLQKQLLGCKIVNLVNPLRRTSIEYGRLRREGVLHRTYGETIAQNALSNLVKRICNPELKRHLVMLDRLYAGQVLPETDTGKYLYHYTARSWLRVDALTNQAIRELIEGRECIVKPKLFETNETEALSLYAKIAKIRNVPNKTKILRLIHGDVYCGVRRKKFKMTDNDSCGRCFQPETIKHLLLECPYTRQVWAELGGSPEVPLDILDSRIGQAELEIRAEIINALVFRQHTLQPEVLIHSVMTKYSKGLCTSHKVTGLAQAAVLKHAITHRWY
jgi:hypothetical protein